MTPSDASKMPYPIPHPDVIARALPDGCVLFQPSTEVYFGLNETGTCIWNALGDGAASEAALSAAVLARWPAAPDVPAHVRELLAQLSTEGLIVDSATGPT